MSNIVVVFPKAEDAKNIKNLLTRYGFQVTAVCTTGAQALNVLDSYSDGIVVCGYKYPDMIYWQLYQNLPNNFEMLLVASTHMLSQGVENGIVSISMPLKVHDLVNTLEMMQTNLARRRRKLRKQPKERSEEEKRVIAEAKKLLMERNHMNEQEAHRYIQKCSMDSGTNIVETAQMVLSIMKV